MDRLKPWLAAGCVTLGLMNAAGASAGITRESFVVTKTRDLVVLCSVPESDPLYLAAVGFCHGYFIGAQQYHQRVTPSEQPKVICLPQPAPSREELIQQYVAWSSTHPQYDNDSPIDTVIRFLAENWICPKPGQ
jgi:hypothetical protein